MANIENKLDATRPLVSILIPCYNAEAWIEDAIDSALSQTYDRKEVIVVDDGSSDRSVEICKKYGSYITLEAAVNGGACRARNRALELAKGELIQYLDADDILLPRKLSTQVPVCLANPKASVTCDCFAFNNAEPPDIWEEVVVPDEDSVIFALRENIMTIGPIHQRSALLRIGGFREDLPCNQEVDLHIRLACAGTKFVHMPEKLWKYRRVVEGSISSDQDRLLNTHRKVWLPAWEQLRRDSQMTDARARQFAALFAKDARSYLWRGDRKQAAFCFKTAQSMHKSGGLEEAYESSLGVWLHKIFGHTFADFIAKTNRRIRDGRQAVSSAESDR